MIAFALTARLVAEVHLCGSCFVFESHGRLIGLSVMT